MKKVYNPNKEIKYLRNANKKIRKIMNDTPNSRRKVFLFEQIEARKGIIRNIKKRYKKK